MELHTISSMKPRQNVSEKELLAVFEDDKARGEALWLVHEDQSFLQAMGEGFGPYILEYFPAERSGTHLRACDELKKQEVRDAMVDFLRGGSAWRESYTWREVQDEKAEGCTGCLAAVLAPNLFALPCLLLIAGIALLVYAAMKAYMGVVEDGDPRWWGLAGLTCLVLGAAFALWIRSWRVTGAAGPKGGHRDPLE